jgi:(p)ppGpp synthase/HD superfamily hydrolase
MKYHYYVLDYDGENTLFRINTEKITSEERIIEVFKFGIWSKNEKLIKFFMNRYLTGWLNEDDAIDYKNAIQLLSVKVINAKAFAIEKHSNQKYGVLPYEVHLISVISVLLRNNILCNTPENIDLWTAAWLHDILEDTDTSEEELIQKFGENVCKIVWSLTDGADGNRSEKKQVMYEKLINNKDAIIVKLADRIANLEFSIINNDEEKINLYVSENKELNKQLNNVITENNAKSLLNYLNNLVQDYQNSEGMSTLL